MRLLNSFLALAALAFSGDLGAQTPANSPPPISPTHARRVVFVFSEGFAKITCDFVLGGGIARGPCATARLVNPRLDLGAWSFSIVTNSYELAVTVPLGSSVTGIACRSRRYRDGCVSEVPAETRVVRGNLRTNPGKWALQSGDSATHKQLVDAFNMLVYIYLNPPDPEGGQFPAMAEAWRAGNRSPLSEAGNTHRVLAENAVREKNVRMMIYHFEAALAYDPTWPEGNFNLALALGEQSGAEQVYLSYYALAAHYMKRYLLLVPDSPDAQAAQEKIIIWEDKARGAAP